MVGLPFGAAIEEPAMGIRIGCQTIVWGNQIPDLEKALDEIAAIGYEGVEFAQSLDQLPPPGELEGMLKKERGKKNFLWNLSM